MIKFITLGPRGSNHQLVTERYLAFHGITSKSQIDYIDTFEEGTKLILEGKADFMVQCAVHGSTVKTVASYFDGLFIIDTFISPSRNLAILKSKLAPSSKTLHAMPPTIPYINADKWEKIVHEKTVMAVAEGLLDGRYEAGLCYVSLAEDNPDRFIVDEFIGSVDDAWIVYGRHKVSNDGLLAWPDSPAAAQFRQLT